MGRIIALCYGLVAYLTFLVAILYAIGFSADLIVPKTIDSGVAVPLTDALIVDYVLLMLFVLQHSVMARPRFKAWWTRFVPKPVERTTYVLFASLVLLLVFWQWRPIPIVVWHIADPRWSAAVMTLWFVGWVIVFTSTFLISHFELFGLHQVVNNLTGRPMPAPRFRAPLFYGFVRHPLYLGFIVAFWAAPTMTLGHLLFATVTTVYILAAIELEERDLIEIFGDDYRRYRTRVSMLLPWRKSARQPEPRQLQTGSRP